MTFGALPRNHFAAIYADPPWHFKTYNEHFLETGEPAGPMGLALAIAEGA